MDNIVVYGARKIHATLVRQDVTVARCTVERLMRAEGLRGIRRQKSRRTTISDGAETRSADLVDREFVAQAPDQLWVANITYVRTHSGWVGAAFVLDVFSRMVVAWRVSTHMRTDLALDALDIGLWSRLRAGQDVTGLTHHATAEFKIEGFARFGIRQATPGGSLQVEQFLLPTSLSGTPRWSAGVGLSESC